MADSRYFSKWGPIPEEHFENDFTVPDPAKMLREGGQAMLDYNKALSERVTRIREEMKRDKASKAT